MSELYAVFSSSPRIRDVLIATAWYAVHCLPFAFRLYAAMSQMSKPVTLFMIFVLGLKQRLSYYY